MIPNTDTYNYNLTCFRTKKKKKKKGVFSYGANTQTQEISVGWQAEGLSPSLCRPVPATDAAISIELRGSEKRVSFQTLTLIHYPRLNKQTMVSSRSHPFRPQVRPGGASRRTTEQTSCYAPTLSQPLGFYANSAFRNFYSF